MKIHLFLNLKYSSRAGVALLLLLLVCAPSVLLAQSDSLIFRDDFNRDSIGADWQANSTWSVENGAASNYIDGTGGTLKTTRYFKATSYIIETTAKGFTSDYWRQFRVVFGQKSLASDSAYVLSYTPDAGGQLTLSKSNDNIYYPQLLDQTILYPGLDSVQYYKFKIAKYKSGLIQVFLDEGKGYGKTPLLEAVDTAYAALGHFGWQEDTQTAAQHFYVDWIEARNPEVEKPSDAGEKPSEDDLVTQVSASSGSAYNVIKLQAGVPGYTDSNYIITAFPDYLKGASLVQTAMSDKDQTSPKLLTLFIKRAAIVYVGYDAKGGQTPAWLKSWRKTGDTIQLGDSLQTILDVYSKVVEYGFIYPRPFILGGNLQNPAAGAQINYIVAIIEKPSATKLEAEDATLNGAVIATNHVGYSGKGFVDFINLKDDYIEWTVKTDVPGYYSIGLSFSNGNKNLRPILFTLDNDTVVTYASWATYSWDSWAFYGGPSVYLSRGVHKIRATATETSGPNVDYLSLSYTATAPVVSLAATTFPDTKSAQGHDKLSQQKAVAYPNPFTQSITISYTLESKGPVSLTVYNLQGLKVAVLADGIQEAGVHEVTLKGNSLQKGLYIYKLKTGNSLRTGRLLKQ